MHMTNTFLYYITMLPSVPIINCPYIFLLQNTVQWETFEGENFHKLHDLMAIC